MLIISQGKKHLIEMNKIIIQASGTEVICYDTSCIADEGYICLGKYESESKALKVLDMIQEAYVEYKITCTFLTGFTGHRVIVESNDICVNGFKELAEGFKKNMVFQMPEDSEVEV
jgi:hypothetical protein